jgi:hypothetical protein
MEAVYSYEATCHHIPDDGNLNSYLRRILKTEKFYITSRISAIGYIFMLGICVARSEAQHDNKDRGTSQLLCRRKEG